MRYTVATKERVIADWQAGSSLGSLVQRYDVPKSTIRRWVHGRPRTVTAPKKPEIDDETIDDIAWAHVKAGQLATEAILRKATDPGWLERQNAADLATLYGVISDKQLRLLAAFHSPADEPVPQYPALPAGAG